MNAGKAPPVCSFVSELQEDKPLPRVPLKRKRGPLLGIAELCYPSPPMSMPPSPPPTQAELHRSTTADESAAATRPTTLSATSSTSPATSLPSLPGEYRASTATTFTQPSSAASATASVPLIPSDNPTDAPRAFATYNTFPARSSRRTSRKAISHVASACVNCKRAHLSCDVQRPCGRCVASGKQDTCYDVQHKKRGRPRLRDEASFQVSEQQVNPAQAPHPVSPSTTIASSSSRPIATPRPRRASSLRTQASEGYQNPALGIPSISTLRAPPQAYQEALTATLAPPDVPTAFLDLDLAILRANRPFEQIMANDGILAGRSLTDIANPADETSLESIRTRLHAERDAREQSSLPPIYPGNVNPLEGISEADIDHLASGFEDHTFTWTRISSSSAGQSSSSSSTSETFPARVRLAKSSTYFIVVTLPTFRPMVVPPVQQVYQPLQPYQPLPQPQPQTQQLLPDPGRGASRSTPQPTPPSLPPPPPYAPSQWPGHAGTIRHQPPHSSHTHRLPPLEPSPTMTPYPRRTSQAEMLPPTDPGGVQLPPIGRGSPSLPGGQPSGSSVGGADVGTQRQRATEEDEDEEPSGRSSKRRRIMGIDNMLQ